MDFSPTTYQILVSVLTGFAVLAIGGALLLVLEAKREEQLLRKRTLENAAEEEEDGRKPRLFYAANRVGEIVSKGKSSPSLQERLARAGYHVRSAASVYMGIKSLLFLGGLLGLSLAILPLSLSWMQKLLVIVFGASVLFFVPNLVLASKKRRRSGEIERFLPDMLDLLEICVSSGMGVDMAWNLVAEELRRVSLPLADEMELTNLEISLGVPRAVAMKHMAERTGVLDISSLVTLLIQSERFGAGIIEALRTCARTMREIRGQRAEEGAEKMSVKLLFPMVVFIFPALLIVMLGPAVVEIVKVMGTG